MSNVVSVSISSFPSPTTNIVAQTQLALSPPTSSTLPYSSLSTSSPSTSSETSSATATAKSNSTSPPIAAIVGASAGALILIAIIMSIWYIFRRRRQQSSKTSPIMSSKGRDLEQQLSSHHSSEKETSRSSPSPHHPRRGAHSHNSSQNEQQPRPSTTVQHNNNHNNNSTQQPLVRPPTPAMIYDHTPPRISFHKSKAASVHSFASLASENHNGSKRSSLKSQHRRQLSTPHTPSPPLLPLSRPNTRSSTPTATTSSTVAAAITINKADAESKRKSAVLSAVANQPTDIHIDMLHVDVEKLLPIIITDEIPAPDEDNVPTVQKQLQQQHEEERQKKEQQKEQSCVTINNKQDSSSTPASSTSTAAPLVSSTPIMPTPTPRRPSLATRKSADGHAAIGGRSRISMSMSTVPHLPHLPTPPPPSIPPPAIPLTYPGGMPDGGRSARPSTETASRSTLYSPVVIANARGRKPRASTESISSAASSARRSISLDSTSRQQQWEESPDHSARVKSNNSPSRVGQRTSKKIILPPNTPPPAPPSGPAPPASPSAIKQMSQQIPVHRRRHQKSPSQILSTGFFVSPEWSPLSPLSPPMSPLTVQIPRNTPSSRLSLLGNNNTNNNNNNNNNSTHAYNTAYNRPDSPTTGYNAPASPLSSSAPANKSARVAHIQAQENRKMRSKSISSSQADAQRVMIPASSSSVVPGPRSPMPTRLSDHLPPPPPVHAHLTHVRSPSQSYQQQLFSKNSWDGSSLRPSAATLTGRSTPPTTGALTKEDEEREREHLLLLQRRSMSLDYWTHLQHLGRSSPTSPTLSEDPEGSITGSVATSTSDLDLQTIISDALAIAQAKSAAMNAARQSSWHRQQELQRQQNRGGNGTTSRPWTPSEDQWGPASMTSSRSQSPFYSTSLQTTA